MQETPNLAISTSYNARRCATIKDVLAEIQALGFNRLELGYLTPDMVADLPNELAKREMTVQSLHNPTPWPVDDGGARLDGVEVDALASPDDGVRRSALVRSRETIHLAGKLGARAVVVHLGQPAPPVPQRQLFALLRDSRLAEFAALRDRAIAEREARKGPYLRAALASIRELGELAGGVGIVLGVETRDGYNEIPSLAELDEVFAATAGLPVGYWHDVGHADKQRQLGIATQEDYLVRFGPRLVGVHLHDTVLDVDHKAPGRGNTDLAAVAKLIPPGALRTLELNTPNTPEDVRYGVAVLRKLGLA